MKIPGAPEFVERLRRQRDLQEGRPQDLMGDVARHLQEGARRADQENRLEPPLQRQGDDRRDRPRGRGGEIPRAFRAPAGRPRDARPHGIHRRGPQGPRWEGIPLRPATGKMQDGGQPMETMTLVFVAVAGLVFGSFFNVVIYRLPRGLNLSRPPSACPGCHAPIKPYDNIPVLSYLVLRGKCRMCGHQDLADLPGSRGPDRRRLRPRLFQRRPRAQPGLLRRLPLHERAHRARVHRRPSPDPARGGHLSGIALALAYSFFRDDLTFRGAVLGAVVGAGFLLLVYGAYKLIRKKEGLGMGDVTMMLMVGAYLGAPRTLLVLILASFTGALFGVWLIVRRGKDAQFALPFGTFIAPAAFVAMIWGAKIVEWYLSRLPALGLRGPAGRAPLAAFVETDRKNGPCRVRDLASLGDGEAGHPDDLVPGEDDGEAIAARRRDAFGPEDLLELSPPRGAEGPVKVARPPVR